jgi:ATP-dependent DNA helicase RecG
MEDMNKKELDLLIQQGEGYNLEFKESIPNDLARTICGFANGNGGKILIGVNDKGTIKGVNDSNRLRSQIQDIARHLSPNFAVGVEVIDSVIVITIPEGTNKPYSAQGKFFMRYGSTTQQLERDEIKEFFEKEGLILFDEKPNYDFNFDKDFSDEAFQTFLTRANIKAKIGRYDLLENLELMKDKKLKNAGVLLFCKSITKFFPGITIMCVVFQGDKRLKILSSEEYTGDLFSNYEKSVEFLKKNLKTEYVIRTAGPREEKLELPEESLREAILNAIGHRSYFTRGSIQINIFSDRVEITNPGGLVAGLSVAELGKESRPRITYYLD